MPSTSYNDNSKEEEEIEIQRAIQDSLRQQQREQGNSPPSYGWFIPDDDDNDATGPPYPTQHDVYGDPNPRDNRKLYPDLSNRNTFQTPSAPPAPNEFNEPNPPYAPSEIWCDPPPYSVDSEIHSRRPLSFKKNKTETKFENESATVKELNVNDLREARLRRFKKD
jgi:hypothetical protein